MPRHDHYAQTTSVQVSKSKSQIQALVEKHGATRFAIMEETAPGGMVQVAFVMNDRNILFRFTVPDTPQETRSRWRCLWLAIKAKLENTRSGIETFEEAFLAQTVMPDGQTIGDHAIPAIERMYSGEHDVPLLPKY